VAIPDYESLMLPVLKLAATNEVRIGDAIERISDELGLTEEERATLIPSGSISLIGNRVHWAKTYLKQAGLVEQPRRGWYKATPRGLEVLAQHPGRIDNTVLMRFPEFTEFRKRSRPASEQPGAVDGLADVGRNGLVAGLIEAASPGPNPEEAIAQAQASLSALLTSELLGKVRSLSPAAFEKLVIELLLAMGYGGSRREAARALGRSGDDGVDGVIDEDALGLDRVFVQAKRYAAGNDVSPAAIREFSGSLDLKKASKGLFVTTSAFSKAVRETAEQLRSRIVLIDGEQLAALMIRFGVGCRVVERIEIKRLDEDFFEDLDT
jgi:restriction system protein